MKGECKYCGKEFRDYDVWCDCEPMIALGKLADMMAPNGGDPITKVAEIMSEYEALWNAIEAAYLTKETP